MARYHLSGVFVPSTTPFDPVTGELDLVGFRGNLRAFLEHPLRGIVVGGSTGEAVLLDEEERRRLLEGARDVIPHDRILVAGTGAESTRSTIHRCQKPTVWRKAHEANTAIMSLERSYLLARIGIPQPHTVVVTSRCE